LKNSFPKNLISLNRPLLLRSSYHLHRYLRLYSLPLLSHRNHQLRNRRHLWLLSHRSRGLIRL
jgi:hypothetical protein